MGMALSYAALKSELQNDPTSLGYAAMLAAGDHAGLAAALNLVRQTITIKRDVVPVPKQRRVLQSGDDGTPASWISRVDELRRAAVYLKLQAHHRRRLQPRSNQESLGIEREKRHGR